MIGKTLLRAVLAAALLVPVPSYAGLKVRFINPERYTDAGSFGAGGRDATLAAFRAHLEKLGARLLTPGQNLTIDVLNIDLAGEYEPWRRNLSDVRIMRDVTPPHIKLSYVLNEKGKRTRSDEKKPSRTRLSPSRSSRARTLGKARSTPSRILFRSPNTIYNAQGGPFTIRGVGSLSIDGGVDRSQSLDDVVAPPDANRARTSGENKVVTLRSNFGKKIQ